MPQVKHTKMLQVADLSWYFGQVVIGQNEGLDFKILPYFVRHMTEVLLPEVEILLRSRGIYRILGCSQGESTKQTYGRPTDSRTGPAERVGIPESHF